MKIAYCLHGQPRQYKMGYEHISKFVEKYDVDFFFHTWHSDTLEYFDYSTYTIRKLEAYKVDRDAITNLLSCYKPIEYMVEEPKHFDIPDNVYSSVAYKNSSWSNIIPKNVNNLFSQMYSREKVKDIFQKHAHKYDIVISSRFDYMKDIYLDLSQIDPSKLYVGSLHRPRYIFPDTLLVCNPKMFCNIANMYSNFNQLININRQIHGEPVNLVMEGILFFQFFDVGYTIDDVIFTDDIPLDGWNIIAFNSIP